MQEIGEIERSLEEYKAFRSFEEDVDGRVQNLSGSIKNLNRKKGCKRYSIGRKCESCFLQIGFH